MRTICLGLFLSLLPASADTLDDALRAAGTSREELGWSPRGWWARYPRTAPHKLDHFDDLFAEPLATVAFARTLGRAARRFLDAEQLARPIEKSDGALYQLAHALGVERRHGGFRAYSANLTAPEAPLDRAIVQLYERSGRQTRFVTFGKESPYPLVEKDLEKAAAAMPPEVSRVLGRLVLNVLDAHRWAELAFRRVPLERRVEAARRLDAGMESVDALEYPSIFDDVA
ncbi:MAG: hypothetical protein ACREID_06500, partial [Planctomycetota bacterium]